jgi:hypothetical protein
VTAPPPGAGATHSTFAAPGVVGLNVTVTAVGAPGLSTTTGVVAAAGVEPEIPTADTTNVCVTPVLRPVKLQTRTLGIVVQGVAAEPSAGVAATE